MGFVYGSGNLAVGYVYTGCIWVRKSTCLGLGIGGTARGDGIRFSFLFFASVYCDLSVMWAMIFVCFLEEMFLQRNWNTWEIVCMRIR